MQQSSNYVTSSLADYTISRHKRGSSVHASTFDQDITSSHMRVNSLSSKASSSDLSLLQTPDPDTSISTITSEIISSSPTDERPSNGKPNPGSLVTNLNGNARARPLVQSAYPGSRGVFAPYLGPRSASAIFTDSPLDAAGHELQKAAPVESEAPPPPPPVILGQHRRTQSVPISSIPMGNDSSNQFSNHVSPAPRVESTVQPTPAPPQVPSSFASLNQTNNNNINGAMNNGLHRHTLPTTNPPRMFSPPAYHNTLPAFPAVNHFIPPPALAPVPMMYPYYQQPVTATPPPPAPQPMPTVIPQASVPRAYYTPQVATPQAQANPIQPISPPPQPQPQQQPTAASPAPTQTVWKINPNSQPQMPLSHLISMSQAGAGGPSAHNRKVGLYKTEVCRNWEEKRMCRYGLKCQFAHGDDEIRKIPRHPKYKTEICRTFWVTGTCPYGKRCCFIHTDTNATTPTTAGPMSAGPNGSSSPIPDDETQQTISLLARLDIKKQSPEPQVGGIQRKTPESEKAGFVYPGGKVSTPLVA